MDILKYLFNNKIDINLASLILVLDIYIKQVSMYFNSYTMERTYKYHRIVLYWEHILIKSITEFHEMIIMG